ncbi:HNH endonuclease [Deinococcus radiotolerans]|uniref:HNH nuclease domain-containing protein n=1 Tax=Deinococcus radiotolerans TaxID=1309407 RepID=A0ABQ2FGA1_9DEIO|nr:HNH endonuclease [Deinococcus radiotolerans]GGK91548.1 hypothetical protein GCM10010844_07550 [Deinococcus radiotolerans]
MTKRNEDVRIQHIRQRLSEATGNGRYEHCIDGETGVYEIGESGGYIADCTRPEIAEFFAHAESDVRYLLDVIDRLTAKRDPIPKKLRYTLLRRAGFRCETCGAGAKEDGVRLQIDHIRPVSRGGTNDPQNLRVLCRDCNAGKGAGPA